MSETDGGWSVLTEQFCTPWHGNLHALQAREEKEQWLREERERVQCVCTCTCVYATIHTHTHTCSLCPRVQVEERFRQIKADENRRKLQQQCLIDDFTDDIFQETRVEEVGIHSTKRLRTLTDPLTYHLPLASDEAIALERPHRQGGTRRAPTAGLVPLPSTSRSSTACMPSTSRSSITQQAESYKALIAASTMLKKKVSARLRVTRVIAIVSRDWSAGGWRPLAQTQQRTVGLSSTR